MIRGRHHTKWGKNDTKWARHEISGVARVSAVRGTPRDGSFLEPLYFSANYGSFGNLFLKFLPLKILTKILGITSILPLGADRPNAPPHRLLLNCTKFNVIFGTTFIFMKI